MPFDADAFLNTPFMGRTDTRRAICPLGRYPAIVTKVTGKVPTDDATRALMEVFCAPQGYQGPPVRYTCWLDVLIDGTLDPADFKNGQLGQLREATNQNWTDRPWTPSMLLQQALMVEVTHRVHNGVTYDQIGTVAAMGAAGAQTAAPPAQAAVAPPVAPPLTPAPMTGDQGVAAAPAAPVAPPAAPVGGNAAAMPPAADPVAPAAPALPAGIANPWGT